MINWLKSLLSNNTQSSMRFCLLTGLILTIFLVIFYVIIAIKYPVWNVSIDVLDKITVLIGVLLTSLIGGKIFQKFAEVKEENKKEEQK